MLFLLNDKVFRVELDGLSKLPSASDTAHMRMSEIELLLQEMFSEEPTLAHTAHEKALKVIQLLLGRLPEVNAAWFRPQAPSCPPNRVRIRYASVGIDIMTHLYHRQKTGDLTAALTEFHVWNRVPMRPMVTRA